MKILHEREQEKGGGKTDTHFHRKPQPMDDSKWS